MLVNEEHVDENDICTRDRVVTVAKRGRIVVPPRRNMQRQLQSGVARLSQPLTDAAHHAREVPIQGHDDDAYRRLTC